MPLNFHRISDVEYGVELIHDGKVRWIGNIITESSGHIKESMFICRRKPEHIFRNMNAIGINAELINREGHDFKFKTIRVLLDGKAYVVSYRKFIAEAVQVQVGGFEPQYMLPLDRWYKMDENEYLTEGSNQLDLGV